MNVMKLASTNKAVPYNENTQFPTRKFHVLSHTALSQITLLYSKSLFHKPFQMM